MLPIIGVAFLTAKRWRWKVVAALAGGFVVNSIILCRTRSAFLGLLVGALVAFLLAPRARRYRVHGLLIAGALIAFTLTDGKFWDRMSTLSSREALAGDAAAETRFAIWRTSYDILADHPYGIGLGNFPRVIGMYEWSLHKRAAHNTLILAFVELGVHGGLVFLALFAGSLWLAYRCSRLAYLTDHPLETKLTAYGMIVSCITYFVTGLGTERFMCESFWWVLVLPLCLHRVVLHEAREHQEIPALVAQADLEDGVVVCGDLQHA
jgi:O-antigen ligase